MNQTYCFADFCNATNIKTLKIINPFAEHLNCLISVFKPRRTNSHYLQFIETITTIAGVKVENMTSTGGIHRNHHRRY